MEDLRNGFFSNSFFTLGDEGEIKANRFFRDSSGLAILIDKILDKYDNHPPLFYTGNVF